LPQARYFSCSSETPAMKSVLGFVSLMAVGLIAASAVAIIGAGGLSRLPVDSAAAPFVDYRSLSIGLVIGLMLSWLARVSWAELPRRVIGWLWANERNFYRGALAAMLIAILIFY
jgi:hypothetical protein